MSPLPHQTTLQLFEWSELQRRDAFDDTMMIVRPMREAGKSTTAMAKALLDDCPHHFQDGPAGQLAHRDSSALLLLLEVWIAMCEEFELRSRRAEERAQQSWPGSPASMEDGSYASEESEPDPRADLDALADMMDTD